MRIRRYAQAHFPALPVSSYGRRRRFSRLTRLTEPKELWKRTEKLGYRRWSMVTS
ncbi:MAG: hypothetical protein OJF47_000599 [Nitrospira sp.]|nr:MAG: hypothetical protein OJF47_000599 [Nitrospira sp.]